MGGLTLKLNIVSPHFQARPGGTGICNFSSAKLPQYEETLKRYPDSRLVISTRPMEGTEHFHFGPSLHFIGNINKLDGGLNDFWSLHDDVCKDFAAREAAKAEAARKEKERITERNRPKTVQVGDYSVTVSLDPKGGLMIAYGETGVMTASEIIERGKRFMARPGFSSPLLWPTPQPLKF